MLGLVVEPVAKEMAEQRIVRKGMALGLDFLAGEDVHDRRQGQAGGIGIGTGRPGGGDAAGGDGFLNGDGRRGIALSEPVRPERGDHKEDRHRYRDRLSKDHPQAMHRKICHRERSNAR